MRKASKKILSSLMVGMMMISSVQAADGNVSYPSGVKPEMISSNYWEDLASNPNQVIMSKSEILELNNQNYSAVEKTHLVDLENISEIPTSNSFERFNRDLFIDGRPIDEDAYIEKFTSGFQKMDLTYAVATVRADVKNWPVTDVVGYTADDPDDECELTYLLVNEPFVIGASCVVDNVKFYYGTSSSCYGWVCEKDLALFDSKSEWLKAWKVNINDNNFIVVNESFIQLEPMFLEEEISSRKLSLGTILKLVPESEIPSKIGEREDKYWYNYVVYLPTSDKNGKYIAKPALIQKRYNVSVGYLPMTESNFLKLSFSKLGDRFGWGGMYDSEDSSSYSRVIYRCFGLDLPRNTTWQENMDKYVVDISDMTVEEKLDYIKSIPVGSILYFPGFSMHYVGFKNNMVYTISACGVVSDPEGELNVRRHYTVMLMPITARRRNGSTWLESLDRVVNFSCNQQTVTFVTNGGSKIPFQTVDKYGLVTKPEDPVKEGFRFDGWYSDSEFKSEYSFDSPVTSSMSIYAKWVEEGSKPTVTINYMDGDDVISSSAIETGSYPVEPEIPTKDGFDFEGWYCDKDFKNEFSFLEPVNQDTVVYSKWIIKNEISEAVNSSSGSFLKGTISYKDSSKEKGESSSTGPVRKTDDEESVSKNDLAFSDVPADSAFYNSINYVVDKGIMYGISETEFDPKSYLTRGMFVTMIYRINGSIDTSLLKNPFSDVIEGHYYSNPIKWAYSEEYIKGYDSSIFGPNDYITKYQLAAILYRYAVKNSHEIGVIDNPDMTEDVPRYAVIPILWAYKNGLMNESDDVLISREKAADIIYRFFNIG